MAESRPVWPGDEIHVDSAAAAYSPGEILQVGGLAAAVDGLESIAIGDPVVFRTKGVRAIAAATGTTFTEGAAVQWDATTNLAVASGDFAVGKAARAKVSGELEVYVSFNE